MSNTRHRLLSLVSTCRVQLSNTAPILKDHVQKLEEMIKSDTSLSEITTFDAWKNHPSIVTWTDELMAQEDTEGSTVFLSLFDWAIKPIFEVTNG